MVKRAVVLAFLCLGAEGVRHTHKKNNQSTTRDWNPKLLPGQIDVKRPAFLFHDETRDRVLISQFGFNRKPDSWIPIRLPGPSSISYVPWNMLKQQVGARRLSGDLKDDYLMVNTRSPLKWPNVLSRVPAEYGDYIVVPDGFLPPGKEDGDIYLAQDDGRTFRITRSPSKTFYHEVEWHDFDGDGLKDILTARCTKSGFFSFTFTGEMLWLKNPGTNGFASTVWTETSITAGPDVIFKSKAYKGGLAVFNTEFFRAAALGGPRIAVQFLRPNGEWTSVREIDNTLGKPFAVDFVDLDDDGVDELLVTNHQGPNDEILPAIFAYEVEWDNLENGDFTRHTLTWGPSENKDDSPGVGAPGFAHGFYPSMSQTSGPKWVFAAGDGSFDVWILKPKAGRFQYETIIIDIYGTTGQILWRDFDGDGVMDLLIPDNDFWKLQVITFE